MKVKQHAKTARKAGRSFSRDYNGALIHRAAFEKTFTVWRDGRCMESGLPSFVAAMNWIEDNPPRW